MENRFMISVAEDKLIDLLIDLGATNEMIHVICSGLTDDQLIFVRLFLLRTMEKKDKIEEADMLLARVYAKNKV